MGDWFYESGGRRIGPVSLDEIKQLLSAQTIQKDTLVWTNEFGPTWKKLEDTDCAASSVPPALPFAGATEAKTEEAKPEPADTAASGDAAAASQGRVNLPLAIASVAIVLGLCVWSFAQAGGFGLFASNVSCSSQASIETVSHFAREQIGKESIVDAQKTQVFLTAIRTRKSGSSAVECAAKITYDIAFKDEALEQHRQTVMRMTSKKDITAADIKSSFEKILNKDITYKVERTDQGGQIYVTVWGL
jgi:hypothetical protein